MAPALAQWDPSAVGPGPPTCSQAGPVLLWVLPIMGEEGECKHPEPASTQGLGGQRGVGDTPAQQPLFFWDPGLEGWDPCWGGGSMAHLHAACQSELAFLSPPYKIPLQLHPQHRRWPGSTSTRSCPTDWSLDPVPPPEPLNPGPGGSPGTGGCGCTCHPAPPSARASLAPNPPATPSPHIFRVRLPQTPNPHAGDAGRAGSPCPAGSRFARERCPVHAVPQAGPAPGLRAAWCACLSPSQAEPSRARGAGRMLQCRRVRQAPIYGQAVWWPQGRPALPPPLAVMQARAGASAEAKGQAGEPANVSLLLI